MKTLRYIINSSVQGLFSIKFLAVLFLLVCGFFYMRSLPQYMCGDDPYCNDRTAELMAIASIIFFVVGFLSRPLLIKIWKTIKKTENSLAEEHLDKKQIITLLLYLSVLILSIIWFFGTFEFEPLIGILVGVAGLFGIK